MQTTTMALIAMLAAGLQDGVPDKIVLRERSSYYVYSLAFSPDGKWLAAPDQADIVVFDVLKAKEAMRLRGVADKKKFDSVTAVAFNLDGTLLASATREGVVKIWDLATGKQRVAIKARYHSLIAVAITADNKSVAAVTGSTPWSVGPTELSLWELSTGKEIRGTKLNNFPFFVGELSFSADGRRLVGASRTLETLTVWDVSTGRPLYALDEPNATRVVFSPDGKRFAADVSSEGVVVWEMTTGRAVHSLKAGPKSDYVAGIAFSHDGKHLAGIFTTLRLSDAMKEFRQTAVLQIWEIGSGKVIVRRDLEDDLRMVVFSPDGRRMVLGNRAGHIQIWKNPIGR